MSSAASRSPHVPIHGTEPETYSHALCVFVCVWGGRNDTQNAHMHRKIYINEHDAYIYTQDITSGKLWMVTAITSISARRMVRARNRRLLACLSDGFGQARGQNQGRSHAQSQAYTDVYSPTYIH